VISDDWCLASREKSTSKNLVPFGARRTALRVDDDMQTCGDPRLQVSRLGNVAELCTVSHCIPATGVVDNSFDIMIDRRSCIQVAGSVATNGKCQCHDFNV
jgi:hypothetical protein